MYIKKWNSDEGLWKSALTLVKEEYYPEAFEVLKAIVNQSLQAVAGNVSTLVFPTPTDKKLTENDILYMQSLSKEIAELIEKVDKVGAVELITEYVDRFIYLFSNTPTDLNELHKKVLNALIEGRMMEPSPNAISTIYDPTKIYNLTSDSPKADFVTTSEAAEIGGVSDQTIRRWCEKGKFPGSYQTDGGHWRIPQHHLKMSLHQARNADTVMKKVDDDTCKQLGEDVDEFNLDYS